MNRTPMRCIKRKIFLTLFFWFPVWIVFAEPLLLEEGTAIYPLGKYLQILEDPTGQLTFQEVLSPEFSQQFVPNEAEIPNFGFTRSVYWVRFEVGNVSQEKDWLLELGYPNLDELDFYFPKASGGFAKKQGGNQLPFDERDWKSRSFLWELPPLSEEPQRFYLRVRANNEIILPLNVLSLPTFVEKDHDHQYVWGIYYGIMGVMFLYNFLLLVGIRHRNYFFYLWYLLSYIFMQLSIDGLAYEYLWPHSPEWNAMSMSVFIFFTLSGALFFARSFLQMPHYTPLLNKLLYGILALAVLSLLPLLWADYSLAIQLGTVLVLPTGLLTTIAAAFCWKQGYRPARYYLLGWSILIISAVAVSLKALGILPSVFFTEYGMHVGSALEVILISLALADRLIVLEQERARIQQKEFDFQRKALEKQKEYRELEQLLARQEVLEREQEHEELIENLNVGVFRFAYDATASVLKANPAVLQIFGYDPSEDLANVHVFGLYRYPADAELTMRKIKEQGELRHQEVQARCVDGRPIWVSLHSSAHYDDEGQIKWVDTIVEDITQQKEAEEKIQRLNDTFEKFVPQQFLKRIASEGIDYIEVGQAQTESLSILFADIHAFTHLSESVSPQELLDFLNTYLTQMNQPIHDSHGFIDKFIGDGIMALFDRSSHATDSFHAAVAMTAAVKVFNKERAHSHLLPISIGVAIHSGKAIIGTIGTQDRMDSTVLGDTVNLAARMENLTGYYNAQIIISSDTYESIKDDSILCRELDFIAVKGKEIPKVIFEVFNGDEEALIEKKQKILGRYTEGLVNYRIREWADALKLFKECLILYPEDVVSQMYIERCQQFQEKPPDETWLGETRMH